MGSIAGTTAHEMKRFHLQEAPHEVGTAQWAAGGVTAELATPLGAALHVGYVVAEPGGRDPRRIGERGRNGVGCRRGRGAGFGGRADDRGLHVEEDWIQWGTIESKSMSVKIDICSNIGSNK